jgi:hypothetical protein
MLGAWGRYVQDETLAVSLEQGAAPAAAHRENAELDDVHVTVGIVKQ